MQAITEELNSQREMMLTKQQYEDDPLWRRPEPPIAPAPSTSTSSLSARAQLSRRPRSAATTTKARFSSNTDSKATAAAAGGGRGSSSTTSDVEKGGTVPQPLGMESPGLTRHKQEIKWHRGPVMGGGNQISNNSTAPILPVTMASLAAKAQELDELSSDEEMSDDDSVDKQQEINVGTDKVVVALKARRPKSAPTSAAIRSFRTSKLKKKEELMKRKSTPGDSDNAENNSSDDDDDYEDEEEVDEVGLEAAAVKKKKREIMRLHKRHALMGPRAVVASDNDHVKLHKTQLAMEIDEFVDLYGQDVCSINYSGGTREVTEGKRVAFTFISTYLMANSKEVEDGEKGKGMRHLKGKRKVKAEQVAEDTLGIMNLFLKDMKMRHDKVQLQNKVSCNCQADAIDGYKG